MVVLHPVRDEWFPYWGANMTTPKGNIDPGELAVLVQDGVPASSAEARERDGRTDVLER